MELQCQVNAINDLKLLSESDSHNIIIEGQSGCGKTYLSKEYSRFINAEGYINVDSNVKSIRNSIDELYGTTSKFVFCVENLDSGVDAVSYAMLKFLEEPYDNIYIIITCRNLYDVPDTIRSRCKIVNVNNPTEYDLQLFSNKFYVEKYEKYKKYNVYESIRSFKDLSYYFSLSDDDILYIVNLFKNNKFKGAVSDIVWKIRNFPDKRQIDLQFVLRYLLYLNINNQSRIYISNCLDDLYKSRMSERAILSKLILNMKYGDLNE